MVKIRVSNSFYLLNLIIISAIFICCDSPSQSVYEEPEETFTYYFRDYGYNSNRIFDLGLPELTYSDSSGTYLYEKELIPGDSIVNLLVYEEVVHIEERDSAFPASINVKPNDPERFVLEDLSPRHGVKGLMYGIEFVYEQNPQKGEFRILFNSRRPDYRALGIYLEVQRPEVGLVTFGNVSVDPLNLKLLLHNNPVPTQKTWKLMWRNVYDLRLRGINISDLNVKVFKGIPGKEGDSSSLDYQENNGEFQSYIKIFGLDQYSNTGSRIADGFVDDRSEIWRSDFGLLIFPSRTPFYTDTVFLNENAESTQPLLDSIPDLYFYSTLPQLWNSSRFYIQITSKYEM